MLIWNNLIVGPPACVWDQFLCETRLFLTVSSISGFLTCFLSENTDYYIIVKELHTLTRRTVPRAAIKACPYFFWGEKGTGFDI